MEVCLVPRGPFELYAYGVLFHALVFPGNEVVVIDAEDNCVVFHKVFHKPPPGPDYNFTSIVNNKNDFFLGLSDGRCIWLHCYEDSRRVACEEFDPFFEVIPDRPKFLLGVAEHVLCITTHNHIRFLSKRKYTSGFRIPYNIEVYNFHAGKRRYYVVYKNLRRGKFVLQYGNRIWSKAYELDLPKNESCDLTKNASWQPISVSRNGTVAFHYNGTFCLLSPFVKRMLPRSFTLGESKINKIGVQCCFAGKNEEYFIYCGGILSEIAVAKYEDKDGIWKHWGSLKTDLFGKRTNESCIQNLGTDGVRLIVHVGLDNDVEDKMPNMLWAFELERFNDIQYLKMRISPQTQSQRNLHLLSTG
jgi:hypothetical protein